MLVDRLKHQMDSHMVEKIETKTELETKLIAPLIIWHESQGVLEPNL